MKHFPNPEVTFPDSIKKSSEDSAKKKSKKQKKLNIIRESSDLQGVHFEDTYKGSDVKSCSRVQKSTGDNPCCEVVGDDICNFGGPPPTKPPSKKQWLQMASRFAVTHPSDNIREIVIEGCSQEDNDMMWVIYIDGYYLGKDKKVYRVVLTTSIGSDFHKLTRFSTAKKAYCFLMDVLQEFNYINRRGGSKLKIHNHI